MALRWASSFDNVQDSDAATFFSSTALSGGAAGQCNFSASYSRWPIAPIGKGMRIQGGGNSGGSSAYVGLIFDAQQTWVMGAAVRLTSPATSGAPGSSDSRIFSLKSSGGLVFELHGSGNALYVARNGTQVGSTGTTLSTSQFYFIEFKVTVHPTAGSYEVRVNGTTYLSGSAVNTSGQGGTTADSIEWGAQGSGGGGVFWSFEYWWDDMYIADGTGSGTTIRDFVGECRPYELLPNANGTFSDWAQTGGTGGSPFTAVNEVPQNGDTSYLASGTINARTTLRYPSVPAGTVKAVILAPWIRKDDANSHSVGARVYRGGIESTSSQVARPSASYTMQEIVMETDPQDGSAWSVSKVNAAEIGLALVS